jgi:hypothetical protein
LALLKLADNFENHVAIAKEGGIQALLRLGRTRTTDDELQYKAALTVGSLASNAVKMLPITGVSGGGASKGASALQSKPGSSHKGGGGLKGNASRIGGGQGSAFQPGGIGTGAEIGLKSTMAAGDDSTQEVNQTPVKVSKKESRASKKEAARMAAADAL